MSPYNILYVDDEPDLLVLCKVYLEETGYFSVNLTESAQDAINLLMQGSIEAVISDYQMPLMDGISLLKEIRRLGIMIPFIIFTGKGRQEVVIEALNAGVDFYIQKGEDPVAQFAELAHNVKRAIEQRRSNEALKESDENKVPVSILGEGRDITDRKLAEETLAKSDQKYRELVENISDVIYEIDNNGVFTYISPVISNVLQYNPDEVIGKNFIDFVYPQDKDLLLKEFEELSKGLEYPTDYRVINKFSEVRWIRTQTKPVIEGGIFQSARGTLIDVTERRQAEENLRTQYETSILLNNCTDLKEAFNIMLSAILEIEGIDSCFLYIRDIEKGERSFRFEYGFYHEVVNYMPQLKEDNEIVKRIGIGKPFYTSYSDIPEFEISESCFDFNFKAFAAIPIRNNGEMIAIILTGSHTLDEIPKRARSMLEMFSIQFENIILRIHFADALKETNAINHKLMENFTRPVILANSDGEILTINQAFTVEFGYKYNDIVKSSLFSCIPPEDSETLNSILGQELTEDETLIYEICLITKSGEKIPVVVRRELISHNGLNTVLLFINKVDHDEQKRIIESLLRANQKLKLFTSITRHDLTNQLMIIDGNLTFAKSSGISPEIKEYLDAAGPSIKNIRNLIEFTKDYQGVGLTPPTWQNITNMVDEAISATRHRNISISNKIDSGLEVYADSLIKKVFLNILDNSIRHGIKTTNILFESKKDDRGLIIIISDDGAGIPAERKKEIFEKVRGSKRGFGLFLSREILSITDIEIDETGTEEKGTRIEIFIPNISYRSAITNLSSS